MEGTDSGGGIEIGDRPGGGTEMGNRLREGRIEMWGDRLWVGTDSEMADSSGVWTETWRQKVS